MTNPTFQHRHYKEIAKVIANLRLERIAKEETASDFADAFARDNARFDRARFMAAARGEPSNGRDKR